VKNSGVGDTNTGTVLEAFKTGIYFSNNFKAGSSAYSGFA